MNPKKQLINIFCLFILLSLVGCAKTPQEVKDEINKIDNPETKKNTVNNIELEYDTIKNIFKTIDKVTATNYDNLTFSHKFNINKPKQIGVMRFHQINNFLDHYKDIVKDFVGTSFNEKYLKLDLNYIPTVDYDDKDKKIIFTMRGKGYMCYISDIQYKYFSGAQYDVTEVEEISLMQEYKDKSYKLQDGQMKISEAVIMAQNYVEQIVSKYDTFQWIPNKVIVYKDTNGRYFYDICFCKAYKNLYFSTTYSRHNYINMPYMAMDANNVMIASKVSPIFFRNNSGIIEYEETVQNYDKIITFECATKLLSKKLSSYKAYEVQYISLENRLILKSNLKDSEIIIDPYNFEADNIYDLDLTPDGGVYAMVDCITGEIEFVDNNK